MQIFQFEFELYYYLSILSLHKLFLYTIPCHEAKILQIIIFKKIGALDIQIRSKKKF